MTPEEKAKELVRKFMDMSFGIIPEYMPMPEEAAKQCALICCEEIIEVTHSDKRGNSKFDKEFWQLVKKQIELL